MKKNFSLILIMLMIFTLSACGSSHDTTSHESAPDYEADNIQNDDNNESSIQTGDIMQSKDKIEQDVDSTEYSVKALNGSIRVPNRYYVFGEDQDFTEQMCEDIGVQFENMKTAMTLLHGQTLIVPADVPYENCSKFFVRVKDKEYDDITLSELSMPEYNYIASLIVSSFGVKDYDTVEKNGLRFFVFTANQGLGDVLRYATILNGHMVYVYCEYGENTISEQQRADLEYIAVSIQHNL